MWLSGAALLAASGLVIVVVVIVHALQAEVAAGLYADATATSGGDDSPGEVPSNTGLLMGAALIAAALLIVLIAHLTGPRRGRRSTTPAG